MSAETIRGGANAAAPTWEESHPISLVFEKTDAIRWLEQRAAERARKYTDNTVYLAIILFHPGV